jgi:MFS transporter, DHA1 family, tetracycline resistance protein
MSSYLRILPVLLLEYLSISLARTILPKLLIDEFQNYSYIVIGLAEAIKGLLAFWACPAIGKLSDIIGRKPCIAVSVIGTTFPVCLLAFTNNMKLYLLFFALSGIFSGTFTLTFAYISDCVEKRKRAPAYGLALATFGFSFTVGPVMGSLVATQLGARTVFLTSSVLVLINLFYISYSLPETKHKVRNISQTILCKCR